MVIGGVLLVIGAWVVYFVITNPTMGPGGLTVESV